MESNNGVMQFAGGATAGDATCFTVNGGPIDGSVGRSLEFYDTASAANAAIVNNTTQASGSGAGRTTFFNNSSAASATITAQGTPGFPNPFIDFMDSSSADNANLILNGGYLSFFDHSTAANATITVNENSLLTVGPAAAANARLIANNGSILISIGDAGTNTARVELHGGTLEAGTAFTAISNTSADPIVGAFSNLADGSALTVGSNTYQVSYEGGSGNDLTLTMSP